MDLRTFQGTRYEIGFQVGRAFASAAQADCQDARDNPPPMSVEDRTQHLLIAWHLLRREFPRIAEELQGTADGAGVRVFDLLLALYEDLWDSEDSETGCTDIVADQRATTTGCLLMGHNNDEDISTSDPVLVRLCPTDGPAVTGVALGGVGLSVGCNNLGLVLMGNQVTAIDVKPGIPRVLLVRAALDTGTVEDALRVLLHPARASSYNNVVGDLTGKVVSVEGSGRRARAIRPMPNGILTHTNHYQHPEMLDLEGKADMHSTTLRENRACQLMSAWAGRHTVETLQAVQRDHTGYPDSICRHSADTVTGFAVIWDVERQVMWYAHGRPCQAVYEPLTY